MAKDKGLTKSCKDCSLKKYENEKKGLKLTHQHFWIRKDGSKITDSWEIVYDYKRYNCTKYRKKKQWKNLWYMAQNTIQNHVKYVKSVMIIVEVKNTKNTKEVNLKWMVPEWTFNKKEDWSCIFPSRDCMYKC